MTIDPKHTRAIVVGIGEYGAGPSWSLDGAAADACRFAEWLLERGVLHESISLHLSPVEIIDRFPGLNEKGIVPQRATQRDLEDIITDMLPSVTDELLFFYWGGHGVIHMDDSRRLFYADATADNKCNLDITHLLKLLRTSFFPKSLGHQIVIVDACAHYVEKMGWNRGLPRKTFGDGKLAGRRQSALFATAPGETAVNRDALSTGLFSAEVLAELRNVDPDRWPPPMESIIASLGKRFEALRDGGKTGQTPTYFFGRDSNGNEIELNMADAGTPAEPRQPTGGAPAGRAIIRSVNRRWQSIKFRDHFGSFLARQPGRPQIYFIHGHEDQCLSSLVMRLKESDIRITPEYQANRFYRNRPVEYYSIDWVFKSTPEMFRREYILELCRVADVQDTKGFGVEALEPHVLATLEPIASKGVIVVEHTLPAERWSQASCQKLIEKGLEYWAAAETIPNIPQFLIFFSIMHTSRDGLGEKLKRGRNWINERFGIGRSDGKRIAGELAKLGDVWNATVPFLRFEEIEAPDLSEIKDWFNKTCPVDLSNRRREEWIRQIDSAGRKMKVIEDITREIYNLYNNGATL